MKQSIVLFTVVCVAFFAPSASAQEHDHSAHAASPYVDIAARSIKALSAEDVQNLLGGAGMGFALAAELNGLPGPRHVLDLKDDLNLTAAQVVETQALFDRMSIAAKNLGKEIVHLEHQLDEAFGAGTVEKESLAAATAEIGRLNGELRGIHLAAHLDMTALLTNDQIQGYARLRGYEE